MDTSSEIAVINQCHLVTRPDVYHLFELPWFLVLVEIADLVAYFLMFEIFFEAELAYPYDRELRHRHKIPGNVVAILDFAALVAEGRATACGMIFLLLLLNDYPVILHVLLLHIRARNEIGDCNVAFGEHPLPYLPLRSPPFQREVVEAGVHGLRLLLLRNLNHGIMYHENVRAELIAEAEFEL